MALPENVECSVPGTCNDCHTMVFFLLMLMKWVCLDHADRWKSCHTQQETQCSYLGNDRSSCFMCSSLLTTSENRSISCCTSEYIRPESGSRGRCGEHLGGVKSMAGGRLPVRAYWRERKAQTRHCLQEYFLRSITFFF